MLYYAVHKGRHTGIYNTWNICKKNVIGYSGAIFKKFTNINDAKIFVKTGHKMTKNSDKKKTKKYINIYTDGSCIKRKNMYYAGYGVYIPDMNIKNSYILHGYKTNNRAELMAIITAIKFFDKNDEITLNIYTDSEYSILIFTSTGAKYNYKIKQGYDVKNKDLVIKAQFLSKLYNLNLIHIKAHTGIKNDPHYVGNDIADKLAKQGSNDDYGTHIYKIYDNYKNSISLYSKDIEIYFDTLDEIVKYGKYKSKQIHKELSVYLIYN
uniref:Transactivator/viroplasmin protein n=1 Tax=Mimivirus LCMiAC02 TaxID=2506609 RepID=A0A481Z1P5_9VIRU|nr:MAG: ribonuclease H [Mimivirus LCMiAC02]